MKIELIETGRNGALTTYRIVGAAKAEDFPGGGYLWEVKGADIVGKESKAGLRKLYNWVHRQNAKAPEIDRSSPAANNRVLVAAGRYRVGDTISGKKITGLGREFYPNADQFALAGISPDYTGTVQYAYFK